MVTPSSLLSQIEQCRGAKSNYPVECAVEVLLIPAFDVGGLAALSLLVSARLDSPLIAEALTGFCARRYISVLEIFSEEEILDGALRNLIDPSESLWASMALTYGQMDEDSRWVIVMRLIQKAPDDDDMLWRIGDGPVSALEMVSEFVGRLAVEERSNPRLAHIRELVRTIP